ncbi:MAG: exodeoxyribonuclease VII small subunit [Porphyromonas sp.]|nr:exodeoxyribonuclease VII small subunit [Porphyromonas sp.]
MSKNTRSYAEASQRLEAIVRIIEHEAPDVDELTKLVEEAVELTKFCRDKLTKADQQLAEIMARLDEGAKV